MALSRPLSGTILSPVDGSPLTGSIVLTPRHDVVDSDGHIVGPATIVVTAGVIDSVSIYPGIYNAVILDANSKRLRGLRLEVPDDSGNAVTWESLVLAQGSYTPPSSTPLFAGDDISLLDSAEADGQYGVQVTGNNVTLTPITNVDATTVTADVVSPGYIDFAAAPAAPGIHTEGAVYWNTDDKTLSMMTDVTGVTLQIGQEMYVLAKNVSGSLIPNGSVVYVSGAAGGRPKIDLADPATHTTSRLIGVVTADISNGGEGYVTVFGLVRDIDTSSFTAGDLLFLSTTPGGLTATKPPAPNHSAPVAVCTVSHPSNGVILVRAGYEYDMDDLSDVSAAAPNDGDALLWDAGNGYWATGSVVTTDVDWQPARDTRLVVSTGGFFSGNPADYTLIHVESTANVFATFAAPTATSSPVVVTVDESWTGSACSFLGAVPTSPNPTFYAGGGGIFIPDVDAGVWVHAPIRSNQRHLDIRVNATTVPALGSVFYSDGTNSSPGISKVQVGWLDGSAVASPGRALLATDPVTSGFPTNLDTTGATEGTAYRANASGSGTFALDNFTAVVAPSATDDSGSNYRIGSWWYDTVGGSLYRCTDDTTAAAVWVEVSAAGGASDHDGTGLNSTAVGTSATASNSQTTAVGDTANASGINSTALGNSSLASGTSSTALGEDATANNSWATAVGAEASATNARSICFGFRASASGSASTALGHEASAAHASSIALGRTATTTAANQLMLGSSSATLNEISAYGTAAGTELAFRNANGGAARNINVGWLTLASYTDATRPAAGTVGRMIYNTDDNAPNFDDGVNWRDAAGVIT